MDDRIALLRALEPRNSGSASYQAILEAAAGLFQQVPADAITLRDILSIAGVSNQTLYNYFPAGRDDVALVLQDRYRKAVLRDFSRNCRTLDWNSLAGTSEVTRALSAALARAIFAPLAENPQRQLSLHQYLTAHRLGAMTSPFPQLEEALAQEILARYGHAFPKQNLSRVVRLSVRSVLSAAEEALSPPQVPLESMESSARKLVRTLLEAGFAGDDPPSGSHGLLPCPPLSDGIVGAPISPAKRETILARMFKRKPRP